MTTNSAFSKKFVKLAEARMAIPPKVYKKAEQTFASCDNRIIRLEDISEFEGQMVLRSFAAKRKKGGSLEVAEIGRKIENEKTIICNCEYRWMAGWVTNWGGEWNLAGSYLANDKKQADFGGIPIYDEKEIVEKFGQYCAWETYKNDKNCVHMSLFKYLSIYRKSPQIEYLVKAGYSSMVPSYRLLNMKGKTFEEIFKCDKKWVEFLKRKNGNMLKIVRNKYIQTEEQAELVYKIASDKNTSKFLKFAPLKYKYDMAFFVDGLSYYNQQIYLDYLREAKQAGAPLDRKKDLIPENLGQLFRMHDEEMARAKQIKDAEVEKAIQKRADELMILAYEEEGLLIRPCAHNSELIQESAALNHCVRTYAKRVADGETAIFFIRHKQEQEKPFVTLELKGKKVIQVRGINNTTPPDEVKKFLKHWGEKFKLNYA